MVIGITKITLHNYRRFFSFFRFNGQIIKELQKSPCKHYKITGSWNLKTWYTMTLWEDDAAINTFYRSGTHLEAMQQAHVFSSKISSKRTSGNELISWKEGKKLFENPQ
jgi:hypothetical protein